MGLAAYSHSFTGVFVLDDVPSIVRNPHIRTLWPLTNAMSAPDEATVAGRPLVSLSLAINYALAPAYARDVLEPSGPGADPLSAERYIENLWGYHLVNLLIHLGAALTLFGIVRRTMAMAAPESASADTALAAALIWTVHPLLTGSVTYIVQRAESLMGLFFLLTLYCAIRATTSRRAAAWMAASIAACAAGMASKEVMIAAPLVVVAWDWVFLKRLRPAFYAGLAATWALLFWLMWTHPRTESIGFGFAAWTWWRYLITQFGVIAHYLRLAIVPSPLVLDYGWPAASSAVNVLPGLAILLAIGAVTIWGLWRRRVEGFLGACFLMILAPTSSVVPIVTEVAAEHRMYLPLAAVVCAVVLLAGRVLARVPAGARRIVGHIATAAVVILFTTMTDARNLDYRSDERIWLDTVLKRPDNARARNNYAVDLLLRGENAAAERELRAAVAIDPAMGQAHANLGVALCKQDRCEEGITHLERALTIDPRAAQARRDLGEAYASRGQLGPAVAQYLAALEIQPDEVFLLNRAAWILATAKDDAVRDGLHALALAERAVVLTQRNDEESLDTLAAALAEAGQFDQAVRAGTEAIIVAQRRGHTAILPELDVRLAQYRSRQAIRQ